jgi:hypothetical protein
MRLFQGVLVLAGGMILSAAPYFAKSIPAIEKTSSVACQGQTDGSGPASGSPKSAPEKGAHMDHMAKHGGMFFMALDNTHHLEGILVAPATFRVYLYDDHTKPLKAEETRKASGTVQIGEADDAPKIELAPGKKKETLEANLGSAIKFPVDLTLLLRLPGMAPDAKPELFNFTFKQFTDERGPGTCHPMANMPNMHC